MPKRILIVDDEPINREILGFALQEEYELLQQETEKLREEYTLQAETLEHTVRAYELLSQLQSTVTPGDQTANADAESLIAELKPLESYLGDTARQTFENLCSRGE